RQAISGFGRRHVALRGRFRRGRWCFSLGLLISLGNRRRFRCRGRSLGSPGHRLYMGNHAMLAQYRLVLLCLNLFQLVTNNNGLATEHAVQLLHAGLEQGPGVVTGSLNISAWRALTLEYKLEHGYPSHFPNGSGSMIAEIQLCGRQANTPQRGIMSKMQTIEKYLESMTRSEEH